MTTEAKEVADVHWSNDFDALRDLARKSLSDPRIINYFSRGHVNHQDVYEILSEDIYTECRTTDAFKTYSGNRNEIDELNDHISAVIKNGSLNFKTILILIGTMPFVLLTFYQLGDKVHPISKILLAIFSAATAVSAGYITGQCFRLRQFIANDVAIILALYALSTCSIVLPLAFAIFPRHPVWLYVNLVSAVVVGILLSRNKTAQDSRALYRILAQAILCVVEWPERNRHKKEWLEHSLEQIIYPKAVLAINRILGEDSTKLLVEQDSEGLRRLQDPGYTVSTRSEYRLRSLLSRIDGGSIAVTGPRGAGKSTLLRRPTPRRSLRSAMKRAVR